ncbi:class I SAM-dependent methyltransferase [Nafulsella turpanensis]|uniref:class I SAM-dependent methyltransferase n=1 Tax=Nafulsella turpanensis TaxID=1265690 RepID=UPI00034594F8|nr:methyltransferase domain-containing protein [Nafulsella turpanensis]
MFFSEKQELRQKLDEFYCTVQDYTAFNEVSMQNNCWRHVGEEIRRRSQKMGSDFVCVLEIGAGRSGFGDWLKEEGLREKVCWSAQDITKQNKSWLETQADDFIFGDVSEVEPNTHFDIIFSTYVLEHVTDPKQHLEHLYRLLRPRGCLFIFCPRYDIPGYFCPSSRHLNLQKRIELAWRWGNARWTSWRRDQPSFLIQNDLAAFHGPFFRDADAVHWVSQLDLKLWALHKGLQLRTINMNLEWLGLKDWVVKRWLTCALEFRRESSS